MSALVLALGPALYALARERVELLSGLDGFLLVAIGGLVALDILPGAVSQAGWWAVAFAAAGFLGPSAIEHSFHRAARQAHRVAMILGIISLGLHAFTDGAALVGGIRGGTGFELPLAVILHRIPVGLTVWWLLRSTFGWRTAAGALFLIAVSTLAGFQFASLVMGGLSTQALGYFQALVAGSLLHVVVHRTESLQGEAGTASGLTRRRRSAGLGALLGLGVVAALTAQELGSSASTARSLDTFLRLSLESAPALVLAYLLAGLISGFLPAASVRWINRGSALTRSWKGMAVGLPLPVCSCGVVPLFQALARQGASAPAALAFLIATPELSLDALLLSVPLLGYEMTALRLLASAAVALLTGWLVGTLFWRDGSKNEAVAPANTKTRPVGERFRAGMRVGLVEVVDHTAPWMLLGLAVAAILEPGFDAAWLGGLSSFLEVPLFALLGMPVYVCASGATPLVAVLLAKGVSPGAALAFLLTGPATNATTFGVVSGVMGRRVALGFAASAALLSIAAGWAANFVVPEITPPALQPEAGAIQVFQWFCLALLSGLFLASLLRQGPRGFLRQIATLDH